MFKKIVLNSGIQIFGKAITLIISILTTILLTRKLGPENYGRYTLIFSFLTILVTFGEWGTQLIGVRELSRAKEKKSIFVSLFILRTILSFIAALLGIILIFILPAFVDIRPFALVSIPLIITLVHEGTFGIVFQSFLKMGIKTLISIGSALVFLTASFFSLQTNLGLWAVIIGWFASTFFTLSSSLIETLKLIEKNKKKFKLKTIKFLAKESLPAGVLLIFFSVYDRMVDSYFIKQFLGATATGYYGFAYKIYSNLTMPAYFLANTIFPLISSKKGKKILKPIKIDFALTIILLIVLVPTVILLSPQIVNLLAGNKFLGSISTLKVLTLALIFAYLNHITGFSLIAINKQTVSLKIGVLALFFNFFSNFFFIPKYGILAAAWTTVFTEALVSALSFLALVKNLKSIYPKVI